MARKVFPVEGVEETKSNIVPPIPHKRVPLVAKGGATASRYIDSAVQGAADRTYQVIQANQISDSPIKDRIHCPKDLHPLIESIKDHGQRHPIIVRIKTESEGQGYEIVAGRRRLAAIRALGQTEINAFVTRMSKDEAFLAQGSENNDRLDTSFMEKAKAAELSINEGFKLDSIGEFLKVQKSLVSMMSSVYRSLDQEIIEAIGPARGVGRRKWERLAELIDNSDMSREEILNSIDKNLDSPDRFEACVSTVQAYQGDKSSPSPVKSNLPKVVPKKHLNGSVSTIRKPGQLLIKTDRTIPDTLLDQLQEQVSGLIAAWENDLTKS